MGLGPIPWVAIVRYMEYHSIPDDQHSTFFAVMAAMDSVYIEWADKESKRRGNVQHKGSSRHNRDQK